MLRAENRFMIKDMYRKGMTISGMARTTGHDRKTIRAIVNGPVNPQPKERKKRASILDPFVPYLERRMEEGVLNCSKLFDEIQRQGYQGGKSTLKNFVQPYREARRREATVRFETEPGEQAQVDWGHFGFIEHQGRRHRWLYSGGRPRSDSDQAQDPEEDVVDQGSHDRSPSSRAVPRM